MPANSNSRALARQWELLSLLPKHANGETVKDLAERLSYRGFEVNKRTVERDLAELSALFPLHCDDSRKPYRWHWEPRQSHELSGITLSEALTLRLVEQSLRPLLPITLLKNLEPRFALASRKLNELSTDNFTAGWADKVASVSPEFHLLPPNILPECLAAVQQALMQGKQVSCRYYAISTGKTQNYILNPQALVQRGHATYLLATVEPYEDIRHFVLHRFEQAELLDSACRTVEGFSLDSYLSSGAAVFGSNGRIELRAWVNAGLYQLLRERPISEDMQHQPVEDGAIIQATVNESSELEWWLLSHAGSIQVLEPSGIRERIAGRLKAGIELHES